MSHRSWAVRAFYIVFPVLEPPCKKMVYEATRLKVVMGEIADEVWRERMVRATESTLPLFFSVPTLNIP